MPTDRSLIPSRAAAILLAAFGLFPLAELFTGQTVWPDYGSTLGQWLLGSAIVAACGGVAFILTRARPEADPFRWSEAAAARILRWQPWPLALAALAVTTYAVIALGVFGGRPRFIDEIVQVWQGRQLAAGHLWLPPLPHPEFVGASLIVDQGARVYGQFPIGGPFFLALGSLLRSEWLVGPVLGSVGVWFFAQILIALDEGAAITVWGSILFALTPFWAFQAGSFMNHVPTVTCLLAGMWGLQRTIAGVGGRGAPFVAGFGFAVAGAIRPLDGLVFALPAFTWLGWRAVREGKRAELITLIAGAALPGLALLGVNWLTTGAPTRFAYTVAWGADHGLGFHTAPWGAPHTPARGFALVNRYFLRLEGALFESPFPSLLPALAALALVPRLRQFDRYLLASGALLTAGYWAYWHDGNFLGPRFLLPLVPMLVLWTARAPGIVRARLGEGTPTQLVAWTFVVAVPLTLLLGLPSKVAQYRQELRTPRWDADRAAAAAGVSHALVLVRESWGSQVVARMWGVGVTRPDAEFLYHHVDLCRLDSAVTSLEHAPHRERVPVQALRALAADSARLIPSPFSFDHSEQFLPNAPYADLCVRRIKEDALGFTLHTPLMLAGRERDNIHVRDLHGRDSLIVGDYPGRTVWFVTADTVPGNWPSYHPVAMDSAWRAWRRGE